MKLLHVNSSILGDNSITRRLSAAVVADWRRRIPDLSVVYRDLAAEPLSHFSAALLSSQNNADEDAAESRRVLEEFLDADIVVVGAPMYNFTVSSQLKAWIDRLAIQGKTFRYTENGPEGLAGGKKAIIVSARGGFYGPGSAMAASDFQEPYLRAVFAFFGIGDVVHIRAEGVDISPESRRQAIEAAERTIANAA